MKRMGQKSCDWELVHKVASEGFKQGIVTLAYIELLERGNATDVESIIAETPKARKAFELIRLSLFSRLLLDVVRAYGPVRNGDYHLRVAFDEIEKHPRIETPQIRDANALEDAVALWKAADGDPRLTTLKHHRDKFLAHTSEPNPHISRPPIDDLIEFARLTCRIWERLSFAVGAFSIELEVQNRAYRESADVFWSKWTGRSPQRS
jgi:AbiU2